MALLTNADSASGSHAVKMMTVHAAKGLEFPYVFLCGLEEGVFPSKKTATLEGMEEERRLAFVAFTRAEKGLYLTDAEGRNLDGSFRYPSRFIFNVDQALLDYTGPLEESLVSQTNWAIHSSERMLEAATAGNLYQVGDRIVHGIMGPGTVLEVDRDQAAYRIKFDDLDTPRNISFKARMATENTP